MSALRRPSRSLPPPLLRLSLPRLLLSGLLLCGLPVPAAAQEEPEAPLSTYPARATVDGGEMAVTTAYTLAGPLVEVAPLAERLGGELRQDMSGEGFFLLLEGTEIAFGPGSASITRGSEILPLSRPPVALGKTSVLAPLDFFERTWGDLLGYRFFWDSDGDRLVVDRPRREEIGVDVDLVHQQGVTTVVFRFPATPRYRLVEHPRGVEVELIGFTLPPAERGRQAVGDPLVTAIDLAAESLRLTLAPGATAESYTLERPFRLVFDVHRSGGAGGAAAGGGRLAPPAPRDGIHTIVLDPGHGGDETGAVGPSGTTEKELVLLLAQTLKSRLQSRLPVRVVLTRSGDVELPLEARTALANQNKADLFLSIHLNSAAGRGGARGAETYFLSLQASDELAAAAAEAENRAGGSAQEPAGGDGDGDPLYDLQLILWDLAQTHHLAESQRLARLIQEELNGALELRDRGVKQAPFRVLMGAAMPAVLVELGFLSDPQEEGRLLDPAYRAQLVDALVRAVARYRAQVSQRSAPAAGGEDRR